MDYTKITLGELLSHENETIRRNATSILKQLQRRKLVVKSDYLETKFVTDKKIYIDYLYSHIEWEHISMDCLERFGTNKLETLSLNELRRIAEAYDY